MKTIPSAIGIRGLRLGFTYIIQCGSSQRIGSSTNVDEVVASEATARLLIAWPGDEFDHAKNLMHHSLDRFRNAPGQFQIPAEMLQWICSLDDREFGAWLTETDCDIRAVGWDFPRVFSRDTRLWRCVFFPESNRVAWSMVASSTKPDYSVIEKLWLQDSRAFNSAWLGTPQKYGARSFEI